jgi:hypothetical protein
LAISVYSDTWKVIIEILTKNLLVLHANIK